MAAGLGGDIRSNPFAVGQPRARYDRLSRLVRPDPSCQEPSSWRGERVGPAARHLRRQCFANGLIGKGHLIPEGVVSTLTVFFWSFAVDWLAFHSPRIRWIAHSGPRQVIRDSSILQAGLRREMLTEEDLRAQLRIRDTSDLANVKEA